MENYNTLLKQGKLPKNKIRFSRAENGEKVNVVGELTNWGTGVPLVKHGNESFAVLEIPNGVYRYNFFDGKNYLLDCKNDRTILAEKLESNIAVIGGTDDPVIHAPGFPMLWQDNSGLTHLKALLRKEFGDVLALYWSDGINTPLHMLLMNCVGEDGQYKMFETVLPEAAQPISYFFEIPTEEYLLKVGKGGKYPEPLKIYPNDIARNTPDWWAASVVYNIPLEIPMGLSSANKEVLSNTLFENYTQKIKEAVPALDELGISVVCLTAPEALQSFSQTADTQLTQIHAEIAKLINEIHAKNMKIVLALQFANTIETPESRQRYLNIVSDYLNLGVDGLKLYSVVKLSEDLLESIHSLAKEFSPEVVILGDIDTDRNFRYLEWFDSRTNYKLADCLGEILTNEESEMDCELLWDLGFKSAFYRGGAPETEIIPVRNVGSKAENYSVLRQVLTICWPGIPFIDSSDNSGLIKELLKIRKANKALKHGNLELLKKNKYFLAYRRRTLDVVTDIIVNFGSGAEEIGLSYDEFQLPELGFVFGDAAINGNKLVVGAKSCAIVEYKLNQEQVDIHNKQRSEKLEAICEKEPDIDTMPRMLYVTLSERCTINCLHCINDSGNITRNGLARDARLWLVDALAPELPFIDYLAFAHGGENIISPILIPLLDRYYNARGDRSKTVHLLSNGMSKFDQYYEAVKHGVNSISISIDGLTSQSNDTVRRGSKIEIILKNLASIVGLKKEFNLRVGVATTITKLNVNELTQLAKLLSEIGIDWFKVEEMYPVNGFGRDIQLDSLEIMPKVIAEIEDVLKETNVVFCDHTDSYSWLLPCKARESNSPAHWEKDSFLNSMLMHPCRLAWEIACIDPNGDVHPLSYHTPPAGNLLQNNLREISKSPAFRDCRNNSLERQKHEGNCR